MQYSVQYIIWPSKSPIFFDGKETEMSFESIRNATRGVIASRHFVYADGKTVRVSWSEENHAPQITEMEQEKDCSVEKS